MAEKRRKFTDLIMVLTALVIFASMLTLVVFAAKSYSSAVIIRDRNSNTRAVDSYILNRVRDSSGNIYVDERSGIRCLVIEDSAYEQVFYEHDGSLMEEYGGRGSSLNPDKALVIGSTERFDFDIDETGMLVIETDSGRVCASTER